MPKGYDTQTEVTITGQYTHFTLGQTAVEVLSGATVVQNASVSSVTAGDSNTQALKFKVNTGLASGNYIFRITTGKEILTSVGNAIVVRSTPTVILGTTSLSAGYSSTTISVTGTNTGFDSTTQVSILDNSGSSTGKAGAAVIASATALSFTVNSGLAAGSYTVKVKTGVEEASAALLVNQPSGKLKNPSNDQDITTMGKYYPDTSVKLVGTNTHFASGTTQLFAFNGSTDVTSSAIKGTPTVSGQTITFTLAKWTSAVGSALTIRAMTAEEIANAALTIADPSMQLTLNSSVASGTYFGKRVQEL